MVTPTLDEAERKHIIFDVVDGIPASEDEREEALVFRREIEVDDTSLRFRAAELGIENILVDFSSECEI